MSDRGTSSGPLLLFGASRGSIPQGFLMNALLISALSFAVLLAGGEASAQATKLKLTLDWKFGGETAPFMMAKAKGYYEKEGLDVQIDAGNGSAAAVNRVASGAYDLGLGDMTTLIEFLANNPNDVRLQAVYQLYQSAPFTIFALKKSGITSAEQLNGKKVAAGAMESTRRVWPIAAPKMNLVSPGIQWVTTDFTLKETMLLRGEVDAMTAFEGSISNIYPRGVKAEDLVVFRFSDYGVKLYGNAILATTKLINENPKALFAFLRASNRAIKDAIANPAEAVRHVKQREPLVEEPIELERFKITVRYLAPPQVRQEGIGSINPRELQAHVDDVAQAFGLKNKPSIDMLFNPKFLPPKQDRVLN
jgi:ABC-type nitrate/sulfonate/bicarbonate transport system substrate-binding protein